MTFSYPDRRLRTDFFEEPITFSTNDHSLILAAVLHVMDQTDPLAPGNEWFNEDMVILVRFFRTAASGKMAFKSQPHGGTTYREAHTSTLALNALRQYRHDRPYASAILPEMEHFDAILDRRIQWLIDRIDLVLKTAKRRAA